MRSDEFQQQVEELNEIYQSLPKLSGNLGKKQPHAAFAQYQTRFCTVHDRHLYYANKEFELILCFFVTFNILTQKKKKNFFIFIFLFFWVAVCLCRCFFCSRVFLYLRIVLKSEKHTFC